MTKEVADFYMNNYIKWKCFNSNKKRRNECEPIREILKEIED